MRNLYILLFVCPIFSACGDSTRELSGGYYYYSESSTDQVIVSHGWKAGDPYIPCNVVDYDWDDHYIIAKQIPVETCFWSKETMDSELPRKGEYFWIIDAKNKKFYGPLGKVDFEKKRKLLGVREATIMLQSMGSE